MQHRIKYLIAVGLLCVSAAGPALAGELSSYDPCQGTDRPDLYKMAKKAAEDGAKGEVANTTNVMNQVTASKTLAKCLDKYKNFSIGGMFGLGGLNLSGLINNAAKAACGAMDSAYDNTVRSINSKSSSVLPGGVGVSAGSSLPSSSDLGAGKSDGGFSIQHTNHSVLQPVSQGINNQIRNVGNGVSNKTEGAVNGIKNGPDINIWNQQGLFK